MNTVPFSSLKGAPNGVPGLDPSGRLKSPARDVVSVKDFLALGDGASNDSAAVTAALAASDSVYFPRGSYVLQGVSVSAGKRLYASRDAVIKLKVQPNLSFTPAFIVTGGGVCFHGLRFDGSRASQPQNGFSDSWNTGGNSTGKSNRAAIYMDNAAGTVGDGLTVDQCEFTEFYAASIATRDVDDVVIRGCRFYDTNLEPCFIYRSGPTSNANAIITGNRFSGIGAGSGVTQGNCIVVSGYSGVVISDNIASDFERTFAKLESCSEAVVSNNVISDNTYGNFPAVQFSGEGHNLVLSGNTIARTKSGVLFTATEPGGLSNIVVTGNIIGPTTAETGGADGIVIERVTDAVIASNTVANSNRIGIYATASKNLSITGNNIHADENSGSAAISVVVPADGGDLNISGNRMSGMQSGADGVLTLSGAGTLRSTVICHNTINGASAVNSRGIFTAGDDVVFSGGIVSGNVLGPDCTIEMYPAPGSSLTVSGNVPA